MTRLTNNKEPHRMTISFEHEPGDAHCLASRKTSCTLVDLAPKTTTQ